MTTVSSPAFVGTGAESALSPDSTDFEAEAHHALSGLDLRLADLRGKVRACERHLVDACRVSLSRVDVGSPASMRKDLMRLHEHHLVRLELSRDHAMHTPQELQRATQALIALVGVIKDWQRAMDCAELLLGPKKVATAGDSLHSVRPACLEGLIRPPRVRVTAARSIPVLGLDWDGTVSCYAAPLGLIATLADRVVIITLNSAITPEQAGTLLGVPAEQVAVTVCPHHRVPDFPAWKAEQCVEFGVSLLFDDEHRVITECRRHGIMAIAVREL